MLYTAAAPFRNQSGQLSYGKVSYSSNLCGLTDLNGGQLTGLDVWCLMPLVLEVRDNELRKL